ncbi:isoprenylcysteine carboxylmethyltransferase family protein [Alloacidobacterium sp.]|uniref:methyltransferase family protein n=1 Tax=Alloacidobacterium sp. TaxID=2951999 RepID=UPI002D33349E|nr:isoprenylcysteine carboxylmethyltransferase family protein [Alloacidobacterium sp.]HYK34948.1 isoprenylcysteine carboxylmethyltransferase family protein [Alloacidobacterium sp.]
MPADWSRVARRIRVPMGFVFAGIYIWLARPTFVSMAWSLLLVLPGIWLRGYAAGYVKKNAELTVTGPYAYTRNPLYLGSMLIAFGFAAASKSIVIVMLLAVLFVIIYVPVIRSEEAFLRSKFAGFDIYAASVPRLLPRFRPARIEDSGSDSDLGSFSFPLYRKHREYNALMGAAAIYAVLALRIIFKH